MDRPHRHRRSAFGQRRSAIVASIVVLGIHHAFSTIVQAKKLEDLLVYRKAIKTSGEVSAILKRPAFSKDFDLKNQLSRSSRRIGPLIAEGYGQLTDRHLAVYLGRARGSVLETLGHLAEAAGERFISLQELTNLSDAYDHIGRMLTRWINYLERTNWKNRR